MYDFTYRKLQKIYTNPQQQKSDESLPGGGLVHGESWEGGITTGLLGVMNLFTIFTVVSQVYAYVKTQQVVQFIYVQLIVCNSIRFKKRSIAHTFTNNNQLEFFMEKNNPFTTATKKQEPT